MIDNGGFTLNGVPISAFSAYLVYGPDQPLAPNTHDRTDTIPGRAGQYWYGSDAGPREFNLTCRFYGHTSPRELDTLVHALASHLVNVHGRPRRLALVFDDSPELTYIVRYGGQISFDRAWLGHSEFDLELIADDPYGYRKPDYETKTITTSPGEFAIESLGNVSTPAKVSITNNGTTSINGFIVKLRYEVI